MDVSMPIIAFLVLVRIHESLGFSPLTSISTLAPSIPQLRPSRSNYASLIGCFDSLESKLDKWMSQSSSPTSSEQPSYHEDANSSHSQAFHSNHLHREMCLPRVEVNKIDGLDPTGWVTQMEHYFSLHIIIDDLAKLRYNVLYLDLEHWQWWEWHKNSLQGYVD
jgi:hypothetical protein